jgi:excisionase family DNA binding protein
MDRNGAEWMTVAEIAVRFGVTVETVRGWVRRGILPVGRWTAPGAPGAPRIRIRRADVRAFAERYYRGKPRPAWLDEPSGI